MSKFLSGAGARKFVLALSLGLVLNATFVYAYPFVAYADSTDVTTESGEPGTDSGYTATEPGEPGTDSGDTTTESGEPGSDSGDTTTEPGEPGTDPGDTATEPGEPGADSGDTTTEPGEPGTDPGDTTTEPGEPGTDPGDTATEPGEPGTDSGDTTTEPGEPGTDSGYTATEPGEPGTDSGDTTTEPGEPGTDPGDTTTEPGEPGTDSGDTTTESGEPTTDPGDPSTEPGEPIPDPEYDSKSITISHIHSGNSIEGGGCYIIGVLHVHDGDGENGGACYETPVYHVHDGSCNDECEITVTTRTAGAGIELCLNAEHFEFTNIGKIEAVIHHSSCGLEDETVTFNRVCYKCYSDDHNQRTFENYVREQLGLGYSHETCVCGMTEETVIGYELSCEKEDGHIDSYELGCGLEERDYGTVILTNTSYGWTGGEVILAGTVDDPMNVITGGGYGGLTYYNEAGEEIGSAAEGISVSANGIYSVKISLDPAVFGTSEAEVFIDVSNIDTTAPQISGIEYDTSDVWSLSNEITVEALDIQPDGSPGSGLADEPYSFDGGVTWQASNTYTVSSSGTYEICVMDGCGNISRQQIEIVNVDDNGPEITWWTSNDEWYEEDGPRSITIGAADGGIGLSVNAYSYDGGETWTNSNTITVDEPGDITVLVRDSLGNITEIVIHNEYTEKPEDPGQGNESGETGEGGEGGGTGGTSGEGGESGGTGGTSGESGDNGGMGGISGGSGEAGGTPGGSGDPGSGSEDPGSGTDDPGSGSEDPGSGTDDPGSGTDDPGSGTYDPGSGTDYPGSGSDDPGSGTDDSGSVTDDPGSGTDGPGEGEDGNLQEETGDTEGTDGDTAGDGNKTKTGRKGGSSSSSGSNGDSGSGSDTVNIEDNGQGQDNAGGNTESTITVTEPVIVPVTTITEPRGDDSLIVAKLNDEEMADDPGSIKKKKTNRKSSLSTGKQSGADDEDLYESDGREGSGYDEDPGAYYYRYGDNDSRIMNEVTSEAPTVESYSADISSVTASDRVDMDYAASDNKQIAISEQENEESAKSVPFYRTKAFKVTASVGGGTLGAAIPLAVFVMMYSGVLVFSYDSTKYRFMGVKMIHRSERGRYIRLNPEFTERSYSSKYKLVFGGIYTRMHKDELLHINADNDWLTVPVQKRSYVSLRRR